MFKASNTFLGETNHQEVGFYDQPLPLTLWPPEGAEVPVDGRISWEADLSVALRHSQSE